MSGPAGDTRNRALLALALLVPVPSVGTWLGMVAVPGLLGQAIFAAAKVWVVLLPVAWLVLVERQRPRIPLPNRRGMLAACVSGAAILVAIAVAYWLLGTRWIEADFVRERAHEVGLSTRTRFVVGALYWCTINSILEEYVWRWFVFTRLERLVPTYLAVAGSGLLFTLHHIIAVDVYFDWRVVVLASTGVFLGGTIWSWLYLRYRNIWAAYVSHVFADVVIFAIGWKLIFG